MSPKGKKAKPATPSSPFRNAFPIEEPKAIVQIHKSRGKAIVAAKMIPAVAVDPLTGRYPTDEKGLVPMRLAPVMRHRCAHINTRHNAPAAK